MNELAEITNFNANQYIFKNSKRSTEESRLKASDYAGFG